MRSVFYYGLIVFGFEVTIDCFLQKYLLEPSLELSEGGTCTTPNVLSQWNVDTSIINWHREGKSIEIVTFSVKWDQQKQEESSFASHQQEPLSPQHFTSFGSGFFWAGCCKWWGHFHVFVCAGEGTVGLTAGVLFCVSGVVPEPISICTQSSLQSCVALQLSHARSGCWGEEEEHS